MSNIYKEEAIRLEDISLSLDETHHIYNDKPLYNKKFELVMSFHSPGVASVSDENGAYHIDLQGNPIYEKRFVKTFGFYDSIAGVEDESGWYHIDLNGNPIYDERYDWVGNFQEQRCPVRDNHGKYFHIKKDGSLAYSEKYKYAGDFKYGIAVAYRNNGLAMHIDKFGNRTHEKKYEELGVFHKGFAVAKDNRGAFHIDKKGKPLYRERYRWAEPFYNNFAFACKYNGEKVIIDQYGNVIHEILNDNSELVKKKARTRLMGMLVGYWEPQIIHSIIKLNVTDYIKDGFNTFSQLLDKTQLPKPSLDMIIRVLKVWNFILERDGKYTLTYMGNLLTEGFPNGLKYAALMWGDEHYLAMSRLFEALKTHKPQFKKLFNEDVFHYFNTYKERGAIFNKAMAEYGLDYDDLLDLYDFQDTRVVMDVGGGSGHLLEKILCKFETIEKGVLFDLPSVIDNATRLNLNEEISKKIEFLTGDFFEEIPIQVDTAVMSRVIHDWNDEKVITILQNVYDALNEGGKLILFETIVPEDSYTDIAVTLNFNLLVCVGGKERTLAEFNTLLKKVNFKIISVKQGNGIISLIVAEKLANRVEKMELNSNIMQWFTRNNIKMINANPFILFIRHAEKQISTVNSDENKIVLTKNGRKEALAFGKEFSLLCSEIQYIKSSPIERCVTTAELILQGMGNDLNINFSTNLGDPGVFITDDKVAVKHFNTYGCEKVVMFQIEGKELEGVRDIKSGTELLLDEILEDLKLNKGIGLYVSHDAIIVPFISYLTGNASVAKNWVNYLEGACVSLDEGKLFLIWNSKKYDISDHLQKGEE